jgi:hypothetical protein
MISKINKNLRGEGEGINCSSKATFCDNYINLFGELVDLVISIASYLVCNHFDPSSMANKSRVPLSVVSVVCNHEFRNAVAEAIGRSTLTGQGREQTHRVLLRNDMMLLFAGSGTGF